MSDQQLLPIAYVEPPLNLMDAFAELSDAEIPVTED
jgi:hypothetical protein